MLNKIAQLIRLNDAVNNYSKMENGLKKLVVKTWIIISVGDFLITGLMIYFGVYTSVGMTAVYIGGPALLIWTFGAIIYYAMFRDQMAGCKDGAHATMIIPAFKILGTIIVVAGAFGLNIFLGIAVIVLIVIFGYKKVKSWIKESNNDTEENNNK